ncbi:hypothetical protein [Kordia sp. SMS9]|uniref:hypothetical protein n=1 Tax=Kordia sp. SMS9 TaxID=2282170 RepID=UPI0013B41237|nr:hypothetical protein [Kordia sp. SMS9]
MLGIPKYKPQYFSHAIPFLKKNKHFLLHVLDKKISNYYVQWNTEFNEWNADGPIILIIDEIQYEFTAVQLCDYSMTINKIDLSKKLDWYGAGDEMPLIWKESAFNHLNIIQGKTIRNIFLIEYNFVLENSIENEIVNEKDYNLVGIEFEFHETDNCLSLTNGLDCNDINLSRIEESIMYRRIQITQQSL